MLKVGITGGIGSGKTTVCEIFEVLGVKVYYADEKAKNLISGDPDVAAKIREKFGEKIFTNSGKIDRKKLAGTVFRKKEALQDLNNIVHPAVAKDYQSWVHNNNQVPYTLKEAALLVETGSFHQLDTLIVVIAPREKRIQRVMDRDGVSRESVLARMKNQLPEKTKLDYANYVIYNHGKMLTTPQVLIIHRAILEKCL